MGNKTYKSNPGKVVSVRGNVVDKRFDTYLQQVNNVLHTGENDQIII